MLSIRSVMLALLLGSPARAPAADGDELLTWIRSERVEVGVLLAGGGRVVVLRRPGGGNVLASDPALWRPAALPVPGPLARADLLGGHMIWVAPQEQWWTQQSVIDEHWGTWPPDPWLALAAATIDLHSADRLTVTGAASPVSGLRLTKAYYVAGDTVHVTTTAVNIRDTAVRWGLWSNLHPLPTAEVIVPFPKPAPFSGPRLELRHTPAHPGQVGPIAFTHVDGCLIVPAPPADDVLERQGKIFLRHTPPWVAVIDADWCLVIATTGTPADQVAPDHAPIEIFRERTRGNPVLLEVEHHGTYRTLAPGERMHLVERWHLADYAGGDAHPERVRFAMATAAAIPAQIEDSPPEPSR